MKIPGGTAGYREKVRFYSGSVCPSIGTESALGYGKP